MYCSYHSSNPARVQCVSCARALCVSCDHRIKGHPYCQDCIVVGIESLSRNYYGSRRSKSRARLAAVCALIPGMGAVFNRQNVKAVVHFITIVGLFQLSDMHVLEGLFALAGVAFYAYSIIDAYRTAQLIAQGESAASDEARFKRSLARRAPAIGLMLIFAGILSVINLVRPFGLGVSAARLVPVALIILGGYLLTSYFKRSRGDDYARDYSDRPPYALMPGAFPGQGAQSARQRPRPGDYR